ncbi:MAG: hypothetical protein CMN30_24915 [Sandaracinus sp.]|nr:hypothetical protein [Sandaracinus sp.]
MDDADLDALLGALAEAPPLPLDPVGPGTRLGPYRVEAPLGRGGMGRVFAAVDTRLDRRVAIKVLEHVGPEACEAIVREARAAAAVEHPALVRVYDVGEAGDLGYVAMELVEGQPLTEGRTDHDAEALARTLAGALAALHAEGLAHRDVKPANVMVDRRGQVKLVDFGLAARANDRAPRGGTPGYAAPEGVDGDAGVPGDVYAFGVLLRWLGGGTTTGPAPRGLRDLAAACTRPDPAQRPADGAALVAALARVARRRRWLTFGAVAVALAASVALAAWLAPPEPPPQPIASAPTVAEVPEPEWERLTDLASSAMLFEGVTSADGSQLAYAERRGLFVRDLTGDRLARVAPASLGAHCVAFAPDGANLWIGAADGVYRAPLVETLAADPQLERHFPETACPMPSPDGRWLALEYDDRLELVGLVDGAPGGEPRVVLEGEVALVVAAFPPDSSRLAALAVRQTPSGSATVDLWVVELDGEKRLLTSDPAFWPPTRGLALVWLDDATLLVGHAPGGPDGQSQDRLLLRTPADRWDPEVHATLPFDPCRLSLDQNGRITATSHAHDHVLLVGRVTADGVEDLADVSRSLASVRPADWSAEPLWVVEQQGARFRALAHPVGDELPSPLLDAPATWPTRVQGGMVTWRLPRDRHESFALIFRDDAGTERTLLAAPEPAPGAAGWGRPPPMSHWASCDPAAPRCLVLTAGDDANLRTIAVPDGEVGSERPLPGNVMARMGVRWTEPPTVAMPLRREGAILVLEGEREQRFPLPSGCSAHGVTPAPGDGWLVTVACQPPEPYRLLRLAPDGTVTVVHREAERWMGDPMLGPGGRIALAGNVFRSNVWRLRAD